VRPSETERVLVRARSLDAWLWKSAVGVLAAAACIVTLPSPAPARTAGGGQLWEVRYNGPENSSDLVRSLGVSPDGTRVFVTGASNGPGGDPDYATVAYDRATGTEQWEARYDGPGNGEDFARSLGVSPDGNTVFVTGASFGLGTGFDYATIAYDAATGVELWNARYDGPRSRADEAASLGVSPDGTAVFVTGFSFGPRTGNDYATAAYDSATGVELWNARYKGRGDSDDFARALAVGPDGSSVFVTGSSNGPGGDPDYATVAYDRATGTEQWKTRYDGPGNGEDFARALAVGPDGNIVFVTGASKGVGGTPDYATVAYDAATGVELWNARYNGPGNKGDSAYSLGIGPDGTRVFVTGGSAGDYATVAYDAATGVELWNARYNGPGNKGDSAYSLGIGPDGTRVFVTGASKGVGGTPDYATLAYDAATGIELWNARYNGPANSDDLARSLGVSPDGATVLVTGESIGSGSGADYATLAYDADLRSVAPHAPKPTGGET
jgi:outer membrane protein assembly factor BamB